MLVGGLLRRVDDEANVGVIANFHRMLGEATHSVLEFISRTREERQITVLLVTHDFAAVRRHARQVLWLHQGTVLHGAADELLASERMAEMFEMGIG